MHIDQVERQLPTYKKRRWFLSILLFILSVLLLLLTIIFIALMIPNKEKRPHLFFNSFWDGFISLNLSADLPFSKNFINKILDKRGVISSGDINSNKLWKLQSILLYPEIFAFVAYNERNFQESFLLVLNIKRLAFLINKPLDKALKQIPPYSGEILESQTGNTSMNYRLLTGNNFYLSNEKEVLSLISRDKIPLSDYSYPNKQSVKPAFQQLFSNLPEKVFLKGFLLNDKSQIKDLCIESLKSNFEDIYVLIIDPFDRHYPQFWSELEWMSFSITFPNNNQIKCDLEFKLKDSKTTKITEEFLRNSYFPEIIDFLQGKALSEINITSKGDLLNTTFFLALDYLDNL